MTHTQLDESSLTTPHDRNPENKWRPQVGVPPLTNEEATHAMQTLNNTSFTDKFPRVDRTFADPQIPLQTIGLISFIPSKGAKPDEKGIYGFAKLRGNFASEMEASQKAEELIRNVDSYHVIHHTWCGRPFPITVSSDYSAVVDEVDIRKETTKTISNSIKDKRDAEQQQIKEIKQKEERLLEESKPDFVADPYDEYITQKVKISQLTFNFLKHKEKMEEVKGIILKTREIIKDLDEQNPTFKDSYYEKYMKARKEAGISETAEESKDNFIRFMVEDATEELGF